LRFKLGVQYHGKLDPKAACTYPNRVQAALDMQNKRKVK